MSQPNKPEDEPGGRSDPPADDEMPRGWSRDARARRNSLRASRPSVQYDVPESFYTPNVHFQPPVENPDDSQLRRTSTRLEDTVTATRQSHERAGDDHGPVGIPLSEATPSQHLSRTRSARENRMARRRSTAEPLEYDVPDEYANLDETMDVSPVQNPDEETYYRHRSLEQVRSRDQEYIRDQQRRRSESLRREEPVAEREKEKGAPRRQVITRFATKTYTISYLVLFAILGTLARLGLQALTYYPGAPVIFSSIWPNFAGSLVFGFLAEDRMLFKEEWGTPTYENQIRKARENGNGRDEETGSGSDPALAVDLEAAKKAHAATKKTIPLYIGLATGFCGSFTSFSSFIRDIFLALSNDLTNPEGAPIAPRNGGYSFMALLAVILLTVSISLAGLFIGAHVAIALEPFTPSLPHRFTRKYLDRLAVVLSFGCWVGAVLLSALPPDRNSGGTEIWRGRATFALVFAPLGCLLRFYASLHLNGRIASFPLGTFCVNMLGTAVLAMAWDLARAPSGSGGGGGATTTMVGIVGCQVLQGVEDGFCGCLTTVSTWVAELAALRRRNAYMYGTISVLGGLALAVAIMGGLRWSDGFAPLACTH